MEPISNNFKIAASGDQNIVTLPNKSKRSRFLVIYIILAASLVVIFMGFLDARKRTSDTETNVVTPVVSQAPAVQSPSVNRPLTVVPTQVKVSYKKDQILKDIAETGTKVCSVAGGCKVDVTFENYAKGTMPQAWWIASYLDGKWMVVLSGNGIPNCSDVDKNEIPEEIYVNCIENGEGLRY